ncbi:NAD-dependent epimerase/dehydratase family protein [Microbacteriaceae bacterium 4G12]
MSGVILVTGATGNVGVPLIDELRGRLAKVRPASRRNTDPAGVRFDFRDPATWNAAFREVDSMFRVAIKGHAHENPALHRRIDRRVRDDRRCGHPILDGPRAAP